MRQRCVLKGLRCITLVYLALLGEKTFEKGSERSVDDARTHELACVTVLDATHAIFATALRGAS